MTGPRARSCLLIIPGILLLVLPVAAQQEVLGAFAGVVRDEQGRPLVGAIVTFSGVESDLVRETRTGNDGRFHQPNFPPGRYLITIRHNEETVWSFPVRLPPRQPMIRIEIDLSKIRAAAERRLRIEQELERLQTEDRQRREAQRRIERHHLLGVRALDRGEPERAIEEFQAALELDPSRSVDHGMLAAAYAAAGRMPDAMASYRRALELEPDEAAYRNNLGTLLARTGSLEEALALFQRAARLDPARTATYRFNTGAALLNAGRAAEAVSPLQQAVRADPTLAVAHYFLALALLQRSPRPVEHGVGRVKPLPGTINAFRRYLQLAPDGPYAEQARDHLRQLDALTPDLLLPVVEPFGLSN